MDRHDLVAELAGYNNERTNAVNAGKTDKVEAIDKEIARVTEALRGRVAVLEATPATESGELLRTRAALADAQAQEQTTDEAVAVDEENNAKTTDDMPLANARYSRINPDWARAGSPAGAFVESVPQAARRRRRGDRRDRRRAVGDGAAVRRRRRHVDHVRHRRTAAATPTAGYAVPAHRRRRAPRADRGLRLHRPGGEHRLHGRARHRPGRARVGPVPVGISFTAGTVPTLRGVSLGNAALTAVGTTIAVTHGSAVGRRAGRRRPPRRTPRSSPTSCSRSSSDRLSVPHRGAQPVPAMGHRRMEVWWLSAIRTSPEFS
jgi:hypothetical protein